jgi:hypothetical protein
MPGVKINAVRAVHALTGPRFGWTTLAGLIMAATEAGILFDRHKGAWGLVIITAASVGTGIISSAAATWLRARHQAGLTVTAANFADHARTCGWTAEPCPPICTSPPGHLHMTDDTRAGHLTVSSPG